MLYLLKNIQYQIKKKWLLMGLVLGCVLLGISCNSFYNKSTPVSEVFDTESLSGEVVVLLEDTDAVNIDLGLRATDWQSHFETLGSWWQSYQDVLQVLRTLNNDKILLVPQSYNTIQDAINVAEVNSVVLVDTGEYFENLQMRDGVSVVGVNKESVVINGSGNGNVVTFKNQTNKTWLNNLTIKNSGENLSGVSIENASPIISNNILLDNYYGVSITGDSFPIIQKNKIQSRLAGVQIFNLYPVDTKTIIMDNILWHNKVAINMYNSKALIEHNTISFNLNPNIAAYVTAGIYLVSSEADIKYNIITDNGYCELCSGVYADKNSRNVILHQNNLWNNQNNFLCLGECMLDNSNVSQDPKFISLDDLGLAENSEMINFKNRDIKLGSRL